MSCVEEFLLCNPAKVGAVVVPLGTLLKGRGLLNLLQDSGVTTLITHADFVALVNGIKDELKGIPDDSYILAGVRESYQFG